MSSLLSGLAAPLLALAELASLAVEVQPGLLRRLRRAFLPHSSPLLEAELWSSPLVSFRSASSLVLLPQVLLELRPRLARDQGRLDAVRAIVAKEHEAISPVLCCEEDLIYWGLVDLQQQPRSNLDENRQHREIQQALDNAVRSIIDGPDRDSLLAWSERALRTLPARVVAHRRARELALLGHRGDRLDGAAASVVVTLPAADRTVFLDWQRDALHLSLNPQAQGHCLAIPAIEPYLVNVVALDSDGASQTFGLLLPSHAEVVLPLPRNTRRLHLESLRRNALELRRDYASTPRQSFDGSWILVTGSVAKRRAALERAAAEQTGRSLARLGCGLITCGYNGVDLAATQAFADELRRLGLDTQAIDERLLRVVHASRRGAFEQGRLHPVSSPEDEYRWPVLKAAAVIVIGWGKGIAYVVDHAWLAGLPTFAFPRSAAQGRDGTIDIQIPIDASTEQAAVALLNESLHLIHAQMSVWPGQSLKKLAQLALVYGSAGWYFRIKDLVEALQREEPIAHGNTAAALTSPCMPERLIGLLAARSADIPSAEIVDALLKELDYARLWREPRLLQEGLLTLQAHLRDGTTAADARLHTLLRDLNVFFESNPHFDASGYFREIGANLRRKAQASADGLDVFALRYESLRNLHADSASPPLPMDALLAEIAEHAGRTALSDQRIGEYFGAETEAKRLVALGLCAGRPEMAPVDIVVRAIAQPMTPFEQCSALLAAQKIGELGHWHRLDALIAGTGAALGDAQNIINNPSDKSRRQIAVALVARAATNLGVQPDALAQKPQLLDLALLGGQRWSGAAAPCVAVIGSASSGALETLSCALGTSLAEYGWRIQTGYGAHIGRPLLQGFKRAGGTAITVVDTGGSDDRKNRRQIDRRFDTLADFRQTLIGKADCVLAIGGKAGALAEAEYALKRKKPVLSLYRTGGSARTIHVQAMQDLLERGMPQQLLAVLDEFLPEDTIAERVVRILNIVYRLTPEQSS
ncbi:hypothetical protein [Tahibacter aquaticus]|nr:hypothetical protein [Tahibacter aquaticus]